MCVMDLGSLAHRPAAGKEDEVSSYRIAQSKLQKLGASPAIADLVNKRRKHVAAVYVNPITKPEGAQQLARSLVHHSRPRMTS